MKDESSDKINIILLTRSFGSGGTEKIFELIFNYLYSHPSFDVSCYLCDQNSKTSGNSFNDKIVYLNSSNIFKLCFALRNMLLLKKPHIVLVGLFPINIILPLVSKTISKSIRPKLILRESTMMRFYYKVAKTSTKFAIKVLGAMYPIYDKIICQSSDMINDMINYYGISKSNLTLINNPIQRPPVRNVDFDFLDNSKKLRLISVGNIRVEKGYNRMLDVLGCFKEAYDIEFTYFIVGMGDQSIVAKLKVLIEQYNLNDNVVFLGHQNSPLEIIKGCDIVLQGSYLEGFPNALLESCVVGVPVIAYNVPGGTKEIIRNGINGYLVEDNNPKAFAERIYFLTTNKLDKTEIIEDILDRFAHDKIMKTYIEFFKSLVLEKIDIKKSIA